MIYIGTVGALYLKTKDGGLKKSLIATNSPKPSLIMLLSKEYTSKTHLSNEELDIHNLDQKRTAEH